MIDRDTIMGVEPPRLLYSVINKAKIAPKIQNIKYSKP